MNRSIHNRFFVYAAVIAALLMFGGCSEDDSKEEGGNTAPNAPSNPVPADSVMFQSVTVDLHWSCSDPDGDPLTYDVYFGTTNNPPLVSSGVADTVYDPDTLQANQMYYWRIVAHDNYDGNTDGPLWKFTTGAGAPSGMTAVPGGTFTMGSAIVGGFSVPEHTVTVPAFFMDTYEVTNDEYKQFCDATSRTYPSNAGLPGINDYFTNPAYAHYPVINVYWSDAHDYAAWAGKRLPTEAEWELAAKGSQDNRLWPWGDTWMDGYANIFGGSDAHPYCASVGSYPNDVSSFGCYDMAGNVTEWCEDDMHASYTGAPADGSAWMDNPRSNSRVMRGGCWSTQSQSARCAYRVGGGTNAYWSASGFRCAKTPE